MAGGVCKYYLQGTCKYGDSCRFQHTRTSSVGGGSREVCKFYLDGKCRFGDRCKFLHPAKGGGGRPRQGPSTYESQRSHYQPPPIDTGRGWNQRGERNQFDLYSSSHYDTNNGRRGGDYEPGRHERDQHPHHKEQWGRSQGDQHPRQKEQWGRSQGDDRYHYSSPNYRQSKDLQSSGEGDKGQDYRPTHGQDNTRREAFKFERRELFKRDEQTPPPSITDPRDLASLIRKDMEESGTMWPFSCYGNSKEIPCVPGLIEMSAEELRLLAYTAQSAGTSSAFLQNLEELKRRQSDTRQQYINITPEEVKNMLTMLSQPSSGDWNAGLFGPVSTTNHDTASVFGSNFSASLSEGAKPQPAFPSLPAEESKLAKLLFSPPTAQPDGITISQPIGLLPAVTPVQSATSQDHTLSKEDLEAFKADKLIIGKIPEHAPPPDLC